MKVKRGLITTSNWRSRVFLYKVSWRNGALCNGSTTDFDSVSLGSIPNAPAKAVKVTTEGMDENIPF